MRKNIFVCSLIILLFLYCVLISGCREREAGQYEETQILYSEYEYTDTWPDNDITKEIIRPDAGEVKSIRDFSEQGRFEINIEDISRDEANEYIEVLKEAGFREVAGAENKVSGGILLNRDYTAVNIAYSGDNMVILISITK
jgi:hypothetical protein